MKVVLDTNILISALIKNSITRKILFTSYFDFFYPKSSLNEINKHKDLILRKSGMAGKDYDDLFRALFEVVTIVREEIINENLNRAKKIGIQDPDDLVFLACALGIPQSIIWSDDADFEGQSAIKVMKTKDIIRHLRLF